MIIEQLNQHAAVIPEVMAFQFIPETGHKTHTITYRDLYQKARAIAARLQHLGIKEKERALLLYPPGLEIITALLGCMYAGIIPIICDPPANGSHVEKLMCIVQDANPQALLYCKTLATKYHQWLTHCSDSTSCHLQITADIEVLQAAHFVDRAFASDDIAILQYTSGSTGEPKGVMLSHGNLTDYMQVFYKFTGRAVRTLLLWVPPYHDLGLICGIFYPLFFGFQAILMHPLRFLRNPAQWLEIVGKHEEVGTAAPNFAYDYCVKNITDEQKKNIDLSPLAILGNGSEPIQPQTLNRFYDAFKQCGLKKSMLTPSYGLAEATLFVSIKKYGENYKVLDVSRSQLKTNIITTPKDDDDIQSLVSCGTCCQEVKIVNPITMHESPANEVGEIWVQGKNVALGYWNDSLKTQLTFHAQIKGDDSGEKYLRSGDTGFLYKGELYVTGRIKDLIIIHGENYHPHEIERTVITLNGFCEICAVFSSPGPRGTEQVTVVCGVTNKNVRMDYYQLSKKMYSAICERHHLSVDRIIFTTADAIPLTTSRKIRRHETKRLVQERKLPVVYEISGLDRCFAGFFIEILPNPPFSKEGAREVHLPFPKEGAREVHLPLKKEGILDELCLMFKRCLGLKKMDVNKNFFSMGGNSLSAAVLMQKISERYGIELSSEDFFSHPTIKELVDFIEVAQNRNRVKNQSIFVNFTKNQHLMPLFCPHPIGGHVSCYSSLAHSLKNQYTVVGIQSPRLVEKEHSFNNIPRMAEFYFAEVQKVQPKGPYAFLGWSMGGQIAFEMARQAQKMGETVSLLALLDSACSLDAFGLEKMTDNQLIKFLAFFAGNALVTKLGDKTSRWKNLLIQAVLKTAGASIRFLQPFLWMCGIKESRVLRDLKDDLSLIREDLSHLGTAVFPYQKWSPFFEKNHLIPPKTQLGQFIHFYDIFRANYYAAKNYQPHYLDQEIVFFSSHNEFYSNWTPYAKRLIVHRLNGNHDDLIRNTTLLKIISDLISGERNHVSE